MGIYVASYSCIIVLLQFVKESSPNITQIATTEISPKKRFNQYDLPQVPMSDSSQAMTGISCFR